MTSLAPDMRAFAPATAAAGVLDANGCQLLAPPTSHDTGYAHAPMYDPLQQHAVPPSYAYDTAYYYDSQAYSELMRTAPQLDKTATIHNTHDSTHNTVSSVTTGQMLAEAMQAANVVPEEGENIEANTSTETLNENTVNARSTVDMSALQEGSGLRERTAQVHMQETRDPCEDAAKQAVPDGLEQESTSSIDFDPGVLLAPICSNASPPAIVIASAPNKGNPAKETTNQNDENPEAKNSTRDVTESEDFPEETPTVESTEIEGGENVVEPKQA